MPDYCHHIYVKEVGKVLIPGCMGVAVYEDLDYCTCSPIRETSIELLEKRIRKLEREIRLLKNPRSKT